MTAVYVIEFAKGRLLAWNTGPLPPANVSTGWRPYIWTTDLARAEKFGSEAGAAAFGLSAIPHDEWSVRRLVDREVDCA